MNYDKNTFEAKKQFSMIHIKSLLKQDIFANPDKKGTIIEVSNEDSESNKDYSSDPDQDFGKKPTISSFKKS